MTDVVFSRVIKAIRRVLGYLAYTGCFGAFGVYGVFCTEGVRKKRMNMRESGLIMRYGIFDRFLFWSNRFQVDLRTLQIKKRTRMNNTIFNKHHLRHSVSKR